MVKGAFDKVHSKHQKWLVNKERCGASFPLLSLYFPSFQKLSLDFNLTLLPKLQNRAIISFLPHSTGPTGRRWTCDEERKAHLEYFYFISLSKLEHEIQLRRRGRTVVRCYGESRNREKRQLGNRWWFPSSFSLTFSQSQFKVGRDFGLFTFFLSSSSSILLSAFSFFQSYS